MSDDAKRLGEHLSIWDQTIGCDNCGVGWWAENSTDDMTLFHAATCPLLGNREAHAEMVNLEHVEKRIGRRLGVASDARDGWRDLAALYVRLHKDEQEAHFSSLYDLFRVAFDDGRIWSADTAAERVMLLVERIKELRSGQRDDAPAGEDCKPSGVE